MPEKKIAIYVEGQTEQIIINHFILNWWNFTGVGIENIKLVNDLKNPVPNFKPDKYDIFFVIINVEGVGNLNSAILERANGQIKKGFEIIGLRDLDYDSTETHLKKFEVLKKNKCEYPDKIDLHFAIKSIEAWKLAFTRAVAKWGMISEENVLKLIREKSPNLKLEEISNPGKLLEFIGKKRGKDPKSYDETRSFVSHINRDEIVEIYESNLIPSFNKFWDKVRRSR